MNDVFERAFAVVVGTEGGFQNNPADTGNFYRGQNLGTKYGLSAAVWYGKTSQWPPTLDDAHLIYRRDYWDKGRCDDLPPPIALVVFDCLVNGGDPIYWLQGAVRVKQDRAIGPTTLAAVAAAKAIDVIAEINAQRLVYLVGRKNWGTFGLGWARRITHLDIAAVGFDAPTPTVTLQTINPTPVVATLEQVEAAVRNVMAERAAA